MSNTRSYYLTELIDSSKHNPKQMSLSDVLNKYSNKHASDGPIPGFMADGAVFHAKEVSKDIGPSYDRHARDYEDEYQPKSLAEYLDSKYESKPIRRM